MQTDAHQPPNLMAELKWQPAVQLLAGEVSSYTAHLNATRAKCSCVGIRLSQWPATPEHPFAHGKELYFWRLIVAVLIFGLGGGVSLYEGLQHIHHPEPLHDPTWNQVVLAAAALFEGISFAFALRQFRGLAGATPFCEALHRSKDPTTYTVLAEDSAALVGLAIAAVGIALTAAADVALAIAGAERRVREQFPMIKRLFIESGASALPQRWSRPDAIRVSPDSTTTATSAAALPVRDASAALGEALNETQDVLNHEA